MAQNPRAYDVWYDGDPDTLTDIGFEVMKKWFQFAMGWTEIHGHRVKNPTGRMASNIRLVGYSPTHIGIIADSPEAEILETGHAAFDMKLKSSLRGRTLPMHRGIAGQYGSRGYGMPASAAGNRSRTAYAAPRAQGSTGFATVPTKVTPENVFKWIIPAMAPWSPAQYLADMIKSGDFE